METIQALFRRWREGLPPLLVTRFRADLFASLYQWRETPAPWEWAVSPGAEAPWPVHRPEPGELAIIDLPLTEVLALAADLELAGVKPILTISCWLDPVGLVGGRGAAEALLAAGQRLPETPPAITGYAQLLHRDRFPEVADEALWERWLDNRTPLVDDDFFSPEELRAAGFAGVHYQHAEGLAPDVAPYLEEIRQAGLAVRVTALERRCDLGSSNP